MGTSWAKGYSSHGHFLGQENTIQIGLVGAPPHLNSIHKMRLD